MIWIVPSDIYSLSSPSFTLSPRFTPAPYLSIHPYSLPLHSPLLFLSPFTPTLSLSIHPYSLPLHSPLLLSPSTPTLYPLDSPLLPTPSYFLPIHPYPSSTVLLCPLSPIFPFTPPPPVTLSLINPYSIEFYQLLPSFTAATPLTPTTPLIPLLCACSLLLLTLQSSLRLHQLFSSPLLLHALLHFHASQRQIFHPAVILTNH